MTKIYSRTKCFTFCLQYFWDILRQFREEGKREKERENGRKKEKKERIYSIRRYSKTERKIKR